MTKVSDMPALRAEDDGFLLQLKWSVLEKHIETLGIGDCETLDDCVGKILKDSQEATDKGSQLPLYIPFRDDDGIIQGCSAKPVWSGTHVDIPLYGNLRIAEVRELITGNRLGSSHLYEGFMAYSPAFRVALLVHTSVRSSSCIRWRQKPSSLAIMASCHSRTSTSSRSAHRPRISFRSNRIWG